MQFSFRINSYEFFLCVCMLPHYAVVYNVVQLFPPLACEAISGFESVCVCIQTNGFPGRWAEMSSLMRIKISESFALKQHHQHNETIPTEIIIILSLSHPQDSYPHLLVISAINNGFWFSAFFVCFWHSIGLFPFHCGNSRINSFLDCTLIFKTIFVYIKIHLKLQIFSSHTLPACKNIFLASLPRLQTTDTTSQRQFKSAIGFILYYN